MPFLSRFSRLAAAPAVWAVLALGTLSIPARADVEHVVSKGHTLQAIANRYHVTVRSIMEKNNLHNAKKLQLGQVLVIPGVGGNNKKKADAPATGATNAKTGDAKPIAASASKPATPAAPAKPGASKYAARAKEPGVVRGHRLATNEDFVLQVGRGRRIPAVTLAKAKNMWRSATNQTHAVDARLLALVGVVSDHFGSRPVEIISGYRPYKTTQYTKDSRHNHGKAIDFRVVGVPNTAVRDFCRTLHNTGCGYYPNSVFVHMDVREQSDYWVDYSRPGEAPKYDKPSPEADEGTSDVHDGASKKKPEDAAEAGDSEADNTPDLTAPKTTTGDVQ